ncbi:MAG TPA: hypothetical protein VLN58_02070 [Verrucomicrobiae bacterium]|nr:hypothetical protein [Verrucomicrobiae bacterium]
MSGFIDGLLTLTDVLEEDEVISSLTPLRSNMRYLTAYYTDVEQGRLVTAMRQLQGAGFTITKELNTKFARFVCTWPVTEQEWETVIILLRIERAAVPDWDSNPLYAVD